MEGGRQDDEFYFKWQDLLFNGKWNSLNLSLANIIVGGANGGENKGS